MKSGPMWIICSSVPNLIKISPKIPNFRWNRKIEDGQTDGQTRLNRFWKWYWKWLSIDCLINNKRWVYLNSFWMVFLSDLLKSILKVRLKLTFNWLYKKRAPFDCYSCTTNGVEYKKAFVYQLLHIHEHEYVEYKNIFFLNISFIFTL